MKWTLALALCAVPACGQNDVQHSSRRSEYALGAAADAQKRPVGKVGEAATIDAPESADRSDDPAPGAATFASDDSPAAVDAPASTPEGATDPLVDTSPPVDGPATLVAGLYYGKADATGKLRLYRDADDVPGIPLLPATGFSVAETAIVTLEVGATRFASRLIVGAPSGKMRRVLELPNVYEAARPALSPDGRLVAFEGRSVRNDVISQRSEIFVADLELGTARVVSQGGDARAPGWFPVTRRILYSAGRDDGGRDLVIVDPEDPVVFISTTGTESAHAAISGDEGEIFVPQTGRTYSARFAPKANLSAAIAAGAKAAGYPDFAALAAVYSPTGDALVLAGTATVQGVVSTALARVDRLGGGFRALTAPFVMAPQTSAGLKYLPVFLAYLP